MNAQELIASKILEHIHRVRLDAGLSSSNGQIWPLPQIKLAPDDQVTLWPTDMVQPILWFFMS